MHPDDPKPGTVVHVGPAASVQFLGDRAITLRVIKVSDRVSYHGWIWVSGYVLDRRGEAIDRRDVFVQRDGLRLISRPSGNRADGGTNRLRTAR